MKDTSLKDAFLGARATLLAVFRVPLPSAPTMAVEHVLQQAKKVEEASAIVHSIAADIRPASLDEAVSQIAEDL